MRFEVGAVTHHGIVRPNNQDVVHHEIRNDVGLFMVLDGMGGEEDGIRAAETAKQTVVGEFNNAIQQGSSLTQEAVSQRVQKANIAIHEKVPDGGTTISMCVVHQDTLIIAHVGDTRVYQISTPENVEQFTRDHALDQGYMMLDGWTGGIEGEIEESLPMKRVLYRALGQNEYLDVDMTVLPIQSTATYMVCSDGLWVVLDVESLADEIVPVTDLQACADSLIQQILDKGAPDNVSVLLFRVR